TIQGTWEDAYPGIVPGTLRRHGRSVIRLLEDFANWDTAPDEILRFTKRYGPVMLPAEGRSQQFSFTMVGCGSCQSALREDWERLMASRRRYVSFSGWSNELEVEAGEKFSRTHGELWFQARTLFRLFQLEVRAIPPRRLKKCARPDCPNP